MNNELYSPIIVLPNFESRPSYTAALLASSQLMTLEKRQPANSIESCIRFNIETAKTLGKKVKFSFKPLSYPYGEIKLEASPQSHDADILQIYNLKKELLLHYRSSKCKEITEFHPPQDEYP